MVLVRGGGCPPRRIAPQNDGKPVFLTKRRKHERTARTFMIRSQDKPRPLRPGTAGCRTVCTCLVDLMRPSVGFAARGGVWKGRAARGIVPGADLLRPAGLLISR